MSTYTCPLVRYICPQEYDSGGRCSAPLDKMIPICTATANSAQRNDGTGFRADWLVSVGWKYCVGDYTKCPYYKRYKVYTGE